jgi:hypothetical protein
MLGMPQTTKKSNVTSYNLDTECRNCSSCSLPTKCFWVVNHTVKVIQQLWDETQQKAETEKYIQTSGRASAPTATAVTNQYVFMKAFCQPWYERSFLYSLTFQAGAVGLRFPCGNLHSRTGEFHLHLELFSHMSWLVFIYNRLSVMCTKRDGGVVRITDRPLYL